MAIGAIFAGASINWLILTPLAQNYLPLSLKFLPLIVTIIGALIFINIYLTTKLSKDLSFVKTKDIIINM